MQAKIILSYLDKHATLKLQHAIFLGFLIQILLPRTLVVGVHVTLLLVSDSACDQQSAHECRKHQNLYRQHYLLLCLSVTYARLTVTVNGQSSIYNNEERTGGIAFRLLARGMPRANHEANTLKRPYEIISLAIMCYMLHPSSHLYSKMMI